LKFKKNICYKIQFLIILVVFLFTAAPAKNPSKVLIVPFNIHSDQDLSFLQGGIKDMLSTRIAYEDKVALFSNEEVRQVVDHMTETISEEAAVAMGEKLQADYVIFGSLTVIGDSNSTDARCIDVRQNKAVVVFNQSGKSLGDLISHIDLFANQVNETIFGRGPTAHQSSRPKPAKEPVEDYRKHPETLWEKDSGGYSYAPFEGQTEMDKETFSGWKSRKFNTKINGIAVGDVDGDGKNETVFIVDKTVHIYRYVDKRFMKIGEVKGKGDKPYISVDAADINHNGKAEIFVSQFIRVSRKLSSFVLEWDGGDFKKIVDNSNWFYRVIHVPSRGGDILMGQQYATDTIFSKTGVYQMEYGDGKYEPIQSQALPKNINIYGFTYGDVLNDRREMIIAFSENDYVRILEFNGAEEWKSSEKYGGSSAYFDKPILEGSPSMEEEKRLYMKQRIHIADMDKDGKNEIVLLKNKDSTGGTFSRLRMYNSGQIESLIWDVIAMRLKWRTLKISGYISDYIIGDLNNDGENELIFCVVSGSGLFSDKEKSYIATWGVKKKQEKE